jgi:hypothetical protein
LGGTAVRGSGMISSPQFSMRSSVRVRARNGLFKASCGGARLQASKTPDVTPALTQLCRNSPTHDALWSTSQIQFFPSMEDIQVCALKDES